MAAKVQARVHCYYCADCPYFEGEIDPVVPKGLEKFRQDYLDKILWKLELISSNSTRVDGDRIGFSIEYNNHRIASVWNTIANIQGDLKKNIWTKEVVLECLSDGKIREVNLKNMCAEWHQHLPVRPKKKLEKYDPAYWEDLGLVIMDSLNIPKSQQHSFFSHKSGDEKKSIED
jgi:hypothetical protein